MRTLVAMKRVLVVDDEENLRLVLRTFLRRQGYEVETAENGEEAMPLIDGFGPETINLSQTAPGQYRVLAHYFADYRNGPSTATVEIHVGGRLAGTFNRSLSCDDMWTIGVIDWNGSSGTFAPADTVQPLSGRGFCP